MWFMIMQHTKQNNKKITTSKHEPQQQQQQQMLQALMIGMTEINRTQCNEQTT